MLLSCALILSYILRAQLQTPYSFIKLVYYCCVLQLQALLKHNNIDYTDMDQAEDDDNVDLSHMFK